jgi:uncharacterized protein (TIGR02246 family)
MTAEAEIRDLVTRWARAVNDQDIDGVVADHADDIVMFDVPPPVALEGLEAYRESWTPFFTWAMGGAVFEIVSMDVHAGDDVAFAAARLRCGRPAELDPARLLRLTMGLRKRDGRWTVAHEHHSFPDPAAG